MRPKSPSPTVRRGPCPQRRLRGRSQGSRRPELVTAWTASAMFLTVGAILAAVLLAPTGAAPPGVGLALLLFVGSSVHVAVTGWLFTVAEIRAYAWERRSRYVWAPVVLVLATGVGAIAVPASAFRWILLPYLAWQFFHYQRQNLGMAALAAMAQRVPTLTRAERAALASTAWLGIAGLMVRPRLVGLRVDLGLDALFKVVFVLFLVAAVGGVRVVCRRTPRDRPFGFCVVYLVSLLFPCPTFVFAAPYAAVGGMTIAHGLQYVFLVGLTTAGNEQGARQVSRLLLMVNVALLGGAALAMASHLHDAAPVGRFAYGAYLGAVMAHFVVDAGLWRLRDPFPRRFLAARLPYLVSPSEDPSRRTGAQRAMGR